MNKLLSSLRRGIVLTLLILYFALTACGGSEDVEEISAPEEASSDEEVSSDEELAEEEEPAEEAAESADEQAPPTAVAQAPTPETPAITPTPDFGSIAYDVPQQNRIAHNASQRVMFCLP